MTSGRVLIELPDLGNVDSTVVVAWLHQVGDAVVEGDDLVEVETEKTTFVIPAPVTGRLAEIRVVEGCEIAVGEILGAMDRSV
ncbi:MAG: lipoyl domain-containing protein [Candidatus Bipolaricaulota bacterium]